MIASLFIAEPNAANAGDIRKDFKEGVDSSEMDTTPQATVPELTEEAVVAALKDHINFFYKIYSEDSDKPWSSQTIINPKEIREIAGATMEQIAPLGLTKDTDLSITLSPEFSLPTFDDIYNIADLTIITDPVSIEALKQNLALEASQQIRQEYTDDVLQAKMDELGVIAENRAEFITAFYNSTSPEAIAETLEDADVLALHIQEQVNEILDGIAERVMAEPNLGIMTIVTRYLGLNELAPIEAPDNVEGGIDRSVHLTNSSF